MGLHLQWYEKRCKGKLHEGEQVVAGVHTHTSALVTMGWSPDSFFYPFIRFFTGRHVVVTNERTLVFGPGMRKIIAQYPQGQANAIRTGNYLTIGGERMFVDGPMIGPLKHIADEVVQSANSVYSQPRMREVHMRDIPGVDELQKADELRQRGVISQQEFDAYKAELLAASNMVGDSSSASTPPPLPDETAAPAGEPRSAVMDNQAEEGWYTDLFGLHEARWMSAGKPTALVRDGEVESHDQPPDEAPTLNPVPFVEPGATANADDLRRADDAEARPFDEEQIREAGEAGSPLPL